LTRAAAEAEDEAMDLAQAFIVYAGWVFSVAWGTVLAAVSVIAFGRDILPSAQRTTVEKERPLR
jgi:uncharacterized membrane protein